MLLGKLGWGSRRVSGCGRSFLASGKSGRDEDAAIVFCCLHFH